MQKLWKTGPREERICYISTLTREGKQHSECLNSASVWSCTCFIQHSGCWWLIWNLPHTLDWHMKSRVVQTCLFIPVKSLGTLYPNKRLFHPLKRGVWLTCCCVHVSGPTTSECRWTAVCAFPVLIWKWAFNTVALEICHIIFFKNIFFLNARGWDEKMKATAKLAASELSVKTKIRGNSLLCFF